MKLVIDISEEYYRACKSWDKENVAMIEQSIIAHGTPYEEQPQSQEDRTKKCPICGSDLYEHCYMCCYEGEKVKRNEID